MVFNFENSNNSGTEQVENEKAREQKEELLHYNAIIVAPAYESQEHKSGLDLNTRLRLLGAALDYKKGFAERIVVGGTQIRKMEETFADLMEKNLIKLGVPKEAIDKETDTFDTSSQINWIKNHIEQYGNDAAIITDPAQKAHIDALIAGFDLREKLGVLTYEDLFETLVPDENDNKRLRAIIAKLHNSSYWTRFEIIEKIEAIVVKYLDPKGEKMRKMARYRLKNDK